MFQPGGLDIQPCPKADYTQAQALVKLEPVALATATLPESLIRSHTWAPKEVICASPDVCVSIKGEVTTVQLLMCLPLWLCLVFCTCSVFYDGTREISAAFLKGLISTEITLCVSRLIVNVTS